MAVVALISGLTPVAGGADGKVPIGGGGAGIVVNGGDTYCTLTSIGNDNTGALIGFTSAHCGGPGAQVASEDRPADGVIGTMVAGNDNLDYAVIRFDPDKVQPISNYKGFVIDGIGPDPVFGGRSPASSVAPPATPAESRGGVPDRIRAPSSTRSAANRATPVRR